MSTILFTEYTAVTLHTDIIDMHKDNTVARVREFRVLSGVGLAPYQLIEFAETLWELGANEPGVKGFRLQASGGDLHPTRLIAEWKVDLPAQVA